MQARRILKHRSANFDGALWSLPAPYQPPDDILSYRFRHFTLSDSYVSWYSPRLSICRNSCWDQEESEQGRPDARSLSERGGGGGRLYDESGLCSACGGRSYADAVV